MKYALVIFYFCFTSWAARAQHAENVHFVYGGDEDKPHGTLVISVGQYIRPTDRGSIDADFGKCVVTDSSTFNVVRQFILSSKYLIPEDGRVKDSIRQWIRSGYPYYYRIVGSDGYVAYLSGKYGRSFFSELKSMLREQAMDEKVVVAF